MPKTSAASNDTEGIILLGHCLELIKLCFTWRYQVISEGRTITCCLFKMITAACCSCYWIQNKSFRAHTPNRIYMFCFCSVKHLNFSLYADCWLVSKSPNETWSFCLHTFMKTVFTECNLRFVQCCHTVEFSGGESGGITCTWMIHLLNIILIKSKILFYRKETVSTKVWAF